MTDIISLLNQNIFLTIFILALFGLLFGSFFNVIIHRLPIMLEQQWQDEIAFHQNQEPIPTKKFNIAWPSSHCPHCKKALKWWHNIPVISYILLKGKCHHCQHKISSKYPAVEILTAAVWAGLGFTYGINLTLFASIILASMLIILMMIDFETHLLPDILTINCLWLGLLFNTQSLFCPTQMAIYGAAAGYLTLWIISAGFQWLRKKQGMGHGDMKMLAMLGAWFGLYQLYFCLLLAVVLGLIFTVTWLVIKKQSKDTPVPFGPALALAGLAFLFIQPHLLGL